MIPDGAFLYGCACAAACTAGRASLRAVTWAFVAAMSVGLYLREQAGPRPWVKVGRWQW